MEDQEEMESFISQNFGPNDLSKLNSTISRGSKRGGTRISLGVALTKAIEKDNIIEDMKEDMDRVIEKYGEVSEENEKLKN